MFLTSGSITENNIKEPLLYKGTLYNVFNFFQYNIMYVRGKTFPFRKNKNLTIGNFFYYAFKWTNQQTNNKREKEVKKRNPITIQIKTVTIIKYHFGNKNMKKKWSPFFYFIQVICLSCVMYMLYEWITTSIVKLDKGFPFCIFL